MTPVREKFSAHRGQWHHRVPDRLLVGGSDELDIIRGTAFWGRLDGPQPSQSMRVRRSTNPTRKAATGQSRRRWRAVRRAGVVTARLAEEGGEG